MANDEAASSRTLNVRLSQLNLLACCCHTTCFSGSVANSWLKMLQREERRLTAHKQTLQEGWSPPLGKGFSLRAYGTKRTWNDHVDLDFKIRRETLTCLMCHSVKQTHVVVSKSLICKKQVRIQIICMVCKLEIYNPTGNKILNTLYFVLTKFF